MKRFALPLTIALLMVSSCVITPVLVYSISPTQNQVLLSVDFRGSALPAGWSLQGSAKFMGKVDASSGIGGVQLVNDYSQEGAVIYGSPFTTQDIIIEFSGMYAPGATKDKSLGSDADDIGIGFYSGGPSANSGGRNPASPNGYYASYEFYQDSSPALKYKGQVSSSGGNLPTSGRNYLFAQTVVSLSPSTISMKALTRTDSPFMEEPSISLGNLLTYNGNVDTSSSTLYVGGASGDTWSFECVYWLRILAYSTTPPSSSTSATQTVSSSQTQTTQPPITQYVTQTATSTQPPVTQTQFVTQTVTPAQTTLPPVLSFMGITNAMMYAAIGIVVVVVLLVGVFVTLRRGRKVTARPVPVATTSQPESVQGISPETAEKLQRLKRMLDLGLITQEDYEEQRKRL